MEIIPCLLDADNPMTVLGRPLGQRIRERGNERLWDERKEGRIDTVVVHYTSAIAAAPEDPFNREHILGIFCDYGVSSHYLIERGGDVLQLVPEAMKAWHAGGSIMPQGDGRTGVNEFSIGIELVATAESGFTEKQYDALVRLCMQIEKRHARTMHYVGHEDIAGERALQLRLRGDVKVDPGRHFNWDLFSARMAQGRREVSGTAV
ncbi:MAG: N-acetylmuramoyl-L-alanine amidase [Chitinispirillaceae bacterium]|nr:N-acetylmuramoyl-L-alanine amidase [Chitinispirillaceae bacterium]